MNSVTLIDNLTAEPELAERRPQPEDTGEHPAASWAEEVRAMRREYLIVVERGPNNFSAYCPDIDGVVATGDTREECIEQMHEALGFHIEGMIEHGETVPPPTSTGAGIVVNVADALAS